MRSRSVAVRFSKKIIIIIISKTINNKKIAQKTKSKALPLPITNPSITPSQTKSSPELLAALFSFPKSYAAKSISKTSCSHPKTI